jgi:hypothetical protein
MIFRHSYRECELCIKKGVGSQLLIISKRRVQNTQLAKSSELIKLPGGNCGRTKLSIWDDKGTAPNMYLFEA